MKLVLKIALGVFLGISGVFIVRRTIEINARDRKFDFERAVDSMTPDDIIAKCGKPLKDVQEVDSALHLRWRFMYYKDHHDSLIVMESLDNDKYGWGAPLMKLALDLNDRALGRKIGEISSATDKVMSFPCMDPNATAK